MTLWLEIQDGKYNLDEFLTQGSAGEFGMIFLNILFWPFQGLLEVTAEPATHALGPKRDLSVNGEDRTSLLGSIS